MDELERKRAISRESSRRYYARKRAARVARVVHAQEFKAICTHDCGCEAEIVKPVCGLCIQGLCDG